MWTAVVIRLSLRICSSLTFLQYVIHGSGVRLLQFPPSRAVPDLQKPTKSTAASVWMASHTTFKSMQNTTEVNYVKHS